jgi:hypothetical protein
VVVELDGGIGRVSADIRSKSLESAEVVTYADVELATLDLAGIGPTASGSTLTWSAVPATLAGPGAAAFAGFYTAGTALDPITVVVDVTGTVGALPGTPAGPTTATTAAVSTSASSVRAGGNLTAAGSGFTAGEQVQVFVHSTPRFVGVVTASADGRVSHTFAVPADLPPGSHKVELRGVSSTRSVFSDPFTVTAAIGGAALPRTGAPTGQLTAIAALLLVVGTTLELASRRGRAERA